MSVTRDTVSHSDLLTLLDDACASGEKASERFILVAIDQHIRYRLGEDVDTDALDDCCEQIDAATSLLDRAFIRAQQMVESFAGRRDWRCSLMGAR